MSQRMTHAQAYKVGQWFDKNLIKHEDGRVSYPKGASDATVAKLFGISVHSVQYLRTDPDGGWGQLVSRRGEGAGKYKKRLEDLERRVTALEEQLTRPTMPYTTIKAAE